MCARAACKQKNHSHFASVVAIQTDYQLVILKSLGHLQYTKVSVMNAEKAEE